MVEIETELTIRNPDDDYIQGKLQIPLPKEAVVTGFAVDITNEEIKHKMVDAVMIPEHRSMRTKNNVSSETAASESSNRFETNIGVILPHGYRTIRMVYTMPLKVESDGSASVLLPMYKNKLRSRSIWVSVNMPEITQPTLSENIGNSFQKKGSVWVLEQTDKNITSEKDIKLAEYIRLRTHYANSSAFYFDVADYFFAEKMSDYATRVLSNLFEYRIFDDRQIRRVYMQRLLNAGELDEAEITVRSISARESSPARDDDDPDFDSENSEIYWSYQLTRVYHMSAKKNNDPQDAQRALNIYHNLIASTVEATQTVGFSALEEFNSLVAWINHQKWTEDQPVIPVLDGSLNHPIDADLRIVIDSDGDRFDTYTYFMGDFMLSDGEDRVFSV